MPRKDAKDLTFQNLVDVKSWQNIQDLFSKITNISLRIIDPEGKLITKPSRQQRICKDLFRKTSYSTEVCGPCLPTFLGGKAIIDKNLSFVCPPGFHNFIAPLKINDGKVVAYIILGPVILVMRRPKEQYRKLAEELSIDIDNLWKEVLEIRVISFLRMQSLVELIKTVAEYILKLSYYSLTNGEKVVDYAFGQINLILKLLLDIAVQASGADMGSIMCFEKDRQNLTIRVSQNLPENIVKNTRVKIGEGVCGIVAQENRPLLIDDSVTDNRIKKYLYRPYLRSSMVIPIQADNKVFGVLNLGALEVSHLKFNEENIKSMNQIIDFTTDILHTPVKQHIKRKSDYFEKIL